MKFIYRLHSVERMFERDIAEEEIESVVKSGEIIESYLDDKPYPSFLVFAKVRNRPLHVVYAKDDNGDIIVITVYEPSAKRWENDFMTRKEI